MNPEEDKAPAWLYDEFKHAGVDYASTAVAGDYDEHHQEFRDYEKDAALVMERLGMSLQHEVIDFGCGTGAFVLYAARACRKIYGIDISPSMLDLCDKKVKAAGLDNVELHNAGFLTYHHQGPPVDFIVSTAAFHHLPDFWKVVALRRMHDMLKAGGRLYLFDVVFSFPVDTFKEALDGWVASMSQKGNQAMAEETVVHIRDEFSTFDWILEEMLVRTGFVIEQKYSDFPGCLAYLCIRQ
ncbi:MAG: class I SAM-dependent methyltransferase [Syntrophomonadaceae bacterium]